MSRRDVRKLAGGVSHRNHIRVDRRVLTGRWKAAFPCAPSGRERGSVCIPVVAPPANFRRASGAKHFLKTYIVHNLSVSHVTLDSR